MSAVAKKLFLVLALAAALALAWWLQQPAGQRWAPWANTNTNASTNTSTNANTIAQNALAPRSAPLVEAATAQIQPMRDQVQAVGTLVARQSVSVRAQSSGRVTQVAFADGQRVRKGQLLLAQDDALQRAQLQQVQAELSLARANHQRNRELVAKGFISQRGQDESAAALQVQQAKMALAQATVERLHTKAPFDAVAGIGNVHVGDYLREGDEIVTLQDMDVVHVDFRLPERYLAHIRQGQRMGFVVDALPGQTWQATIAAIDPQVDAQGRSVAVRASLPNEGLVLRPGMFARVNLTLDERPHAVVVPEEAVLPTEGGAQVLLLRPEQEKAADGSAHYVTELATVQLGARGLGVVEVVQGVAAGDLVMTAGFHRVSQGGQRVRLAQAQQPMAQPDANANAGAAAPAKEGL